MLREMDFAEREELADERHARRAQACRCGGDMPGRCPGPNACPMACDRPLCRVCGEATRHRQDADDTWICDACEENDE